MTAAPGLRELMRAGVRRSVATEYRRLIAAGVNRATAVVLARTVHRCAKTCGRPDPGWQAAGSVAHSEC